MTWLTNANRGLVSEFRGKLLHGWIQQLPKGPGGEGATGATGCPGRCPGIRRNRAGTHRIGKVFRARQQLREFSKVVGCYCGGNVGRVLSLSPGGHGRSTKFTAS